jgi:hypothetical protein
MDAFDTFDAMADCPACGLPHANAASQQECLARHAARVAAPARSGFDAGLSIPLESERLGRWAVPAGLLVARLLMGVSMAQAMTRIWVSMWFHELGHAVTAWFCGFTAMPMPWVTSIGQERSWLMVAALAVAIGLLFRFGWQTEQKGIWGLAVGLWAVQAVGTLGASQPRAQLWITFGGDGGALVIGALFVLAFHLRFDEAPHWGELRWGGPGAGRALVGRGFHPVVARPHGPGLHPVWRDRRGGPERPHQAGAAGRLGARAGGVALRAAGLGVPGRDAGRVGVAGLAAPRRRLTG